MKLGNVLFAAALAVATLYAQTQTRFEVATVKPSGPQDFEHCAGDGPSPGRISWKCIPLRELIQQSYASFANGVLPAFPSPVKITGGPGWIDSDRFDIEAKASGNPAAEVMAGPMTQALLEDRFKLKLHRETREQPVYSLTVAKGGLKIQPLTEPCAARDLMAMMKPPAPGAPPPNYCGTVRKPMIKGQNMAIDLRSMTMQNLAAYFSTTMDRTVLDKTSVAGIFDMKLEFVIDDSTRGFPGARAAVPTGDPGPSLFTAIQQLGLKLESDKGPVEFLVIDHVEKPSEN
jgi:uncharacterized protein (TIGR03435 family)